MKMKVWLSRMEIEPLVYAPDVVKLTVEARLHSSDVLDVPEMDLLYRAGKPLFLVTEPEPESAREIEFLKTKVEILTAERDAAMARLKRLKGITRHIVDGL